MKLKRILSYILIVSFILLAFHEVTWSANVESANQPIASGTVTQANIRISAVNGTAFVDFSAADVLTGKLGSLLVIKDSAGAAIQGVIKAAGTGETLATTGGPLNDGQLITNPTFDANTTGWDFGRGTIASSHPAGGGQSDDYLILTSNGETGGPYCYQSVVVASGALLFQSMYIKSGTAGVKIVYIYYYNSAGAASGTSSASWVQISSYKTAIVANGNCVIIAANVNNEQTTLHDEVSLKQVLTPSTTGVTIVSAKGGATYNWTNKSALFNYASATFTYQIYRTPPVVVASGTVTQANFHADLTTDNAFVELVGVDLTAYQTGSYSIGIYNVTGGYGILGHISATAPAGETLGVEKYSDPVFDVDATWTKGTGWTIAGGKANAAASSGNLTQTASITETQYALYKMVITCDSYTSGSFNAVFFGIASGPSSTATASFYRTSDLATEQPCGVRISTALTATFTDISLKRVTDPPSTGARIVSTKGGATRAWYWKHASFDPNQANGVTYKVYYLGQ